MAVQYLVPCPCPLDDNDAGPATESRTLSRQMALLIRQQAEVAALYVVGGATHYVGHHVMVVRNYTGDSLHDI